MYKKPLYNAATDFTHAGLLAEVPIILVVRKDLPAKDFKEFITYAKANQGKMQFGSAGAGAATHLGCVLLNYVIGVDITHVPYRGTGPAMQDLVGGRIDYLCEVITTAKPQVEGGAVRALAIFDKQRSSAMPDLPTALEQGTRDLEAYTWYGMFFPKGTPDAVISKINAVALESIKTPAVRAKLQELGAQFVSDDRTSPKYLGEFVQREIEKWSVPIKAAGVQVD